MATTTRRPAVAATTDSSVDTLQRQCPTLPGASRRLIEHRISSASCQERQRTLYHKCHRCVYRGKPADFVAEPQPIAMPSAAPNGQQNGVAKNGQESPAVTAAQHAVGEPAESVS